MMKWQEEIVHGQANLPSVGLKKTVFYPGEVSEGFKSQWYYPRFSANGGFFTLQIQRYDRMQ